MNLPFKFKNFKENMESIDWKTKAHAMKDMYEQLVDLRIDSVKYDIEEIRAKIEEHKKIHELAVKELTRQNQNLREKIEEAKSFKQGLSSVQSSIIKSRRELSMKDPILKKVFKHEELHLLNKSKNMYLIGKGSDYQYQFVIWKSSDDYIYEPVQVPSDIKEGGNFGNDITKWVREKITVDEKNFDKLLDACAGAKFEE